MCELLTNNSLFVGQLYEDKSLAMRARDLIFFTTHLQTAGPFPAILGKGPWPKLGKKIDLSKLGEINDIEHYKGSKIYPQNQVILDCIMPSIPLKHKCLSIILIWVSVSHSLKKVKRKKIFFLLFLIAKIRHGIGKKVAIFDWEWGRNSAPRDGQKRP